MRKNKVSIIAEFCQNHNGNTNILSKMIDKAVENGATHLKIQNIFANELTFRPKFENGIKINKKIYSIKRPYKDEYKRLKKLELSIKQIQYFKKKCESYSVIPLITCFTRSQINLLKKLNFKLIKVASIDCASYQLLRDLVDNFDEIIVSTGGTYDNEIKKAASILNKKKFSFLHCVSIYPTPMESVNLSRLNYLKKFTKTVGYSDHTKYLDKNLIAIKFAIYLGAEIIEKHFTILNPKETRDGIVSMNEKQLNEISKFSKLSKSDQKLILSKISKKFRNKLLGKSNRKLTDVELLNRDYYRGRFASTSKKNKTKRYIYNWDEVNNLK